MHSKLRVGTDIADEGNAAREPPEHTCRRCTKVAFRFRVLYRFVRHTFCRMPLALQQVANLLRRPDIPHAGHDMGYKLRAVQTVVMAAANVADATILTDLLHGDERPVWSDQIYRGQRAVIRAQAPKAKDFTHRAIGSAGSWTRRRKPATAPSRRCEQRWNTASV